MRVSGFPAGPEIFIPVDGNLLMLLTIFRVPAGGAGDPRGVFRAGYNEKRPHQGRRYFGKTPMQTFLDALPLAKEKPMAA
jgi:hypothetical protein